MPVLHLAHCRHQPAHDVLSVEVEPFSRADARQTGDGFYVCGRVVLCGWCPSGNNLGDGRQPVTTHVGAQDDETSAKTILQRCELLERRVCAIEALAEPTLCAASYVERVVISDAPRHLLCGRGH